MSTHPATWLPERLLAECTSRRQRRSGPGGQHRNKVETAVIWTHVPTKTKGEATERRSQEQNRQMALFRLRVNLALCHRVPRDLESESPSELWRQRCVSGKIGIRPTHQDFPALLSEALDVLFAANWDIPRAAGWLACTPSQLIRLLRKEPRALARVNEERRSIGLHDLK